MTRLFVFGTLKKGFPFHSGCLNGAKYLGACRTVKAYPMFIAGPWFAPMMLDKPGDGLRVSGELYEIDQPALTRIDAVESVGKPGNFRISIEVEPLEGGGSCQAFAYAKSEKVARPVHSAFLAEYQDRRFIPPWSRATGSPRIVQKPFAPRTIGLTRRCFQ
jgi:gamma-glutamylaminecyclotransferase